MQSASRLTSTSHTTDRPSKRQRLASPNETLLSALTSALPTPDSSVSPVTSPLPLTQRNLRALNDMTDSKKRKGSAKSKESAKSKKSDNSTTATSQATTQSKPPSETQAAIRGRLLTYRIHIFHQYYYEVPQIETSVKKIVAATRGSPGLSDESITSLQKRLSTMMTDREATVAGQLITELFTTPHSHDKTVPLKYVQDTGFIAGCIPRPDTARNKILERALQATKPPSIPKPDFTFGVDPKSNVFSETQNDLNSLLADTASIVDGILYPFFIVEWKATYAGGNHGDAAIQAARGGAAIVSSIVSFYRQTTPSISDTDLRAKSLCFSATVDSYLALIYVHWWSFYDGQNHWNMHIVSTLTFLDEDPLRFRRFRQMIDNIMDWGMNERLGDIKAALTMYIDAQTERAKEDAS